MLLKKSAALALAVVAGLSACAVLPSRAADDKAEAAKAVDAVKADAAKSLKSSKGEATLAAAEVATDADGFLPLFNGKDLGGWEGLPGYWSVQDGAIVAKEEKATSKQTFLVYKGGPVSDFELHWKYKFVTEVGNSGVQFRSKLLEPTADNPYRVGGYQADCDAGNGYTGIIYEESKGYRGIVSKRGEKTVWGPDDKPKAEKLDKSADEIKAAIKKPGEWNDCVLVAKGNHFVYSINGVVTTDMTDDSPKLVKEGILALQCHAGFTMEIQFKDIKMKSLKAEAK
jgi:hypothetical protein